MRNFKFHQNKSVNSNKVLLLFCLLSALAFPMLAVAQVTVNSLSELLPYLDDDNANVKLAPGTYTISASDITNGTFSSNITINDKKAYSLFLFQGNNSTYDFTGVTINVKTEVFNAINSDAGDFFEVQTVGNNNVIKNMTLVDVGSVDDFPKYGCVNVVMDGSYNRIEGFHITATGSFPYGYGDSFGKGGGSVISHKKHSAFLIRGESNHAKDNTLIHRAYGHCMFMQAANNPLIEGCVIEGEMRSTDDMLAEEGTGSPADLVDFFTVWGYRLPPGYMMSTGEAGIRAYNAGQTVIDGVGYSRSTSNVTVKNCTIKNMRTGVTIAHASGTKYVEGCVAIGCENGFSLGSGDVVDCYADAQYGPVYGSTYESDKNYNAEITILEPEGEYYNGSGTLAYIGGTGHTITLKGSEVVANQDLMIKVGGDKGNIRLMYGNLPHQNDFSGSNFTLNNLTNFPVFLSDKSSNINGQSGGMVTDWGTNNNIVHTAVSVDFIEAEAYTNMSGVQTEITTDEGAGENITAVDATDWFEYEMDVPYSGTYNMDYRVASASVNGDFILSLNGETLEDIIFNATGGAQSWTTISSSTPFYLTEGTQTLRITANSADWNINWLDLSLACADVKITPYYETFNAIGISLDVVQSTDVKVFPGNTVSLQPEPSIGGTWSWTGPNGFTADTRVIKFTDVDDSHAGDYVVTITNDCGQQSSVNFTLAVTGSLLVEAESYSDNNGVSIETTSDEGSGDNVTSIEANDWMEYTFDLAASATYAIDFRVASATTGDFSFSVDGVDIEQVTFNATGGAQTWTTTRSTEVIYFEEGTHTLKITANSAGWNINWLKLVGQDYVSPCNLPFQQEGFMVQNESVSWTTGLMDITCVSNINVYVELSQTGTLMASDLLDAYYIIDGGERIEIAKSTGNLSNKLGIVRELSGTTLEIIIEGVSTSADNYYTVDKISVVETTDPFARIEAEDYDDMQGMSSNGSRLGSIAPGEWSMYAGLDLTGVKSITASLSSVYSDATVEVRLDSIDGPLIATIGVPTTGDWNSYTTAKTYLDEVVGVYDVYLVYQTVSSANVCNIDWLQFSDAFVKRPTDPYLRFEAEINDKQSGASVTETSDIDGNEELGGLTEGDYIMFSNLDIEEATSVVARVASASGGVIEVRVGSNKGDIIAFIDVPNTGDATTWQTLSVAVDVVAGENDIYFVFKGEGDDLFNLNWLKFSKGSDLFPRLEAEDYTTASEDMRAPTATTDAADNGTGEIIKLIKPNYWLHFEDVDLSNANSVSTRFATAYDDVTVEVRLDAVDGDIIATIDLYDTDGFGSWGTTGVNIPDVTGVHDVYFVYQTESSAYACYSNWFQFSEFEVPELVDPLSRIEAEDYTRASGIVTTGTSDTDGEEEVGNIQDGDWILYKDIDLTDITKLNIRYATANSGGSIIMRTGSYDGKMIGYILLPSTNSNWETLNYSLFNSTPDGLQDIYLLCNGSSDDLFNINWLQFQTATSALSDNEFENTIQLYPNPVSNYLTIEDAVGSTVELYNMLGKLISVTSINSPEQTIDFSQQTEGYYFVKATKGDGTVETFKIIKN